MEKRKCTASSSLTFRQINSSDSYWAPTVSHSLCLILKWLGTEMVLSSLECKYVYSSGHCGLRDEMAGTVWSDEQVPLFLVSF